MVVESGGGWVTAVPAIVDVLRRYDPYPAAAEFVAMELHDNGPMTTDQLCGLHRNTDSIQRHINTGLRFLEQIDAIDTDTNNVWSLTE